MCATWRPREVHGGRARRRRGSSSTSFVEASRFPAKGASDRCRATWWSSRQCPGGEDLDGDWSRLRRAGRQTQMMTARCSLLRWPLRLDVLNGLRDRRQHAAAVLTSLFLHTRLRHVCFDSGSLVKANDRKKPYCVLAISFGQSSGLLFRSIIANRDTQKQDHLRCGFGFHFQLDSRPQSWHYHLGCPPVLWYFRCRLESSGQALAINPFEPFWPSRAAIPERNPPKKGDNVFPCNERSPPRRASTTTIKQHFKKTMQGCPVALSLLASSKTQNGSLACNPRKHVHRKMHFSHQMGSSFVRCVFHHVLDVQI